LWIQPLDWLQSLLDWIFQEGLLSPSYLWNLPCTFYDYCSSFSEIPFVYFWKVCCVTYSCFPYLRRKTAAPTCEIVFSHLPKFFKYAFLSPLSKQSYSTIHPFITLGLFLLFVLRDVTTVLFPFTFVPLQLLSTIELFCNEICTGRWSGHLLTVDQLLCHAFATFAHSLTYSWTGWVASSKEQQFITKETCSAIKWKSLLLTSKV
jgi:hypothetical protein